MKYGYELVPKPVTCVAIFGNSWPLFGREHSGGRLAQGGLRPAPGPRGTACGAPVSARLVQLVCRVAARAHTVIDDRVVEGTAVRSLGHSQTVDG